MSTSTTAPSYNFSALFEGFRAELDDYNDRRERLIKASRDITNLSKKVIFLLHRTVIDTKQEQDEDDKALYTRAANLGYEKLREVQQMYANLQPELVGDNFWRHQRQVSPGLQEYIEALSLAHYLEKGTLITFDEVQSTLKGEDGVEYFPLTTSDYILGLSDLTGELMRFAISGFSRRGGRQKASQVCAFVRNCRSDFEGMTPYIRELSKKQAVTTQSLEKIEDAAYAVVLRTSEYELSSDMLDDIVAQSLSAYSAPPPDGRVGGGRMRRGNISGGGGGGYGSGEDDEI